MVYFIGNNELVKIGFTDNIQQRVSDFEGSLPFKFQIFAVIEGDEAKEQFLHNFFRKFHVEREWFKLSDEIKDFILITEKLDIKITRRKEQVRHFGELKGLRLNAGLTMMQMGERIGVHATQVDKFEKRFEKGIGNIKSLIRYLDAIGYEFVIQKRVDG